MKLPHIVFGLLIALLAIGVSANTAESPDAPVEVDEIGTAESPDAPVAVGEIGTAESPDAPLKIEEIKTCVEANNPQSTMRQHWTLLVADRAGNEQALELDFEWKLFKGNLSKFVTRVTSPPDMRGSAVLVIQNDDRPNDVFSYLPELGKTRRVTSRALSGSAFSSDFSQEDLQYLRGLLRSGDQTLLPDSEKAGRPVRVVEGRGEPDSAYEKVLTFVDSERCVLVEAEMYQAGGKLLKVIRADPEKVVARGEAFEPTEIRAEDQLRGTHSVLKVEDSEIDIKIKDKTFSLSSLERQGR